LKYSAAQNTLQPMIKGFRCRDTERLFGDQAVPRFRAIERLARRKLLLLHRAIRLDDLRAPPAIAWKRLGRSKWSIRIND
jgi:proteic killer suppression protein